jgi:hypothetical protein
MIGLLWFVLAVLASPFKKSRLEAENAVLRHQLMVLRRRLRGRVRLTNHDRLPEDDKRLGSVEILLENTGVVSGEFGMVDAMRERKALMLEWMKDDNARIQSFASRCVRRLDNRIATEQRDAEMRKEQRKRDYE